MAKRLKKTTVSSIIAGVLCIELFSLLPKIPRAEDNQIPFTAAGAIHVSTPQGLRLHPFEWLKDPAKAAKLDFIVAVSPDAAPLEEGAFGGVDFFVEDEVKIPAGDLLVFHSHGVSAQLKGEPLKRVALDSFEGRANPPDFFSVISHPSHVKAPWNRFDRYTEGMEILNFDSQRVRVFYDSPFSFLGGLLSFPFNQFEATLKFLQPYPKDLASWDEMNALSPGHFGVVAHDLTLNFGFSEASPFHESIMEKSFRTAQNILFLKEPLAQDFKSRKNQIYSAIREGRMAIAFSLLYPFQGNDWTLDCDGTQFRSGDKAILGKSCLFHIKSPASFPFKRRFKLYRNGELIKEFESDDPNFNLPVAENGIYRLEVWAKTRTLFRAFISNDTPYVLYNPIYVN